MESSIGLEYVAGNLFGTSVLVHFEPAYLRISPHFMLLLVEYMVPTSEPLLWIIGITLLRTRTNLHVISCVVSADDLLLKLRIDCSYGFLKIGLNWLIIASTKPLGILATIGG